MGKRALRRIQPFLLFFFALVSPALAQSNFFENKTIKLVLGFSPGGISDLWGRALARAMSQTLPGRPNIILQNMPGAGSMTAANYIYSVAKPDGLAIGFVTPGLYFNQLTEMREVQFDWAKFAWIGSPERTVRIMYGRADTPYKTLEDIRNAAEAPRCGATALGTVGHYFPRLIEAVAGVKFSIVTGYPGAAEIDLAMQKNEVHCRAGSLEGYFGSEPTRGWAKSGFSRVLVHGSAKRDPRLPEVPTVNEILEKRKAHGNNAPFGDGAHGARCHRPAVNRAAGHGAGPGCDVARWFHESAGRSRIRNRSAETQLGTRTRQWPRTGSDRKESRRPTARGDRRDEKNLGALAQGTEDRTNP